jgi:hypothetical protein
LGVHIKHPVDSTVSIVEVQRQRSKPESHNDAESPYTGCEGTVLIRPDEGSWNAQHTR